MTIPAGVSSVHVHLDVIAGRTTRNIGMLEWESLVLYPAHVPVRQIAIQPSVTVPVGWGVGTALSPLDKVATPPTTGVNVGTFNGVAYTANVLRAAVVNARTNLAPIHLSCSRRGKR